MFEERDLADFLLDIRESALDAIEFAGSMSYEQFRSDKKTKQAVIRSLEVIGEATKHIPDTFRNKYPAIPWKQMAGMRDRLIHGYFGVDEQVVWETVQEFLPRLINNLSGIEE
jgi:uncharacterized protein with HEPN domain